MSQRIDLEVTPARLKAFRGENVESTISLSNRGQSVDQFTISVEGIDSEWYTLPVSSVALFPNDQDKVKILIHLPEDSEIREKSYLLKIKVTSQENPDEISTADVALEIGSVPSLLLDLSPLHLEGRGGRYQLSLTNPGDRDVKVNLKAFSPQRRLRLETSPDSLTLSAGKNAYADIDARLHWMTLLRRKSYQFQVSAEPADRADITPVSGNGELTSVPWYRIFQKIRLPWMSRTPVIKTFSVTTDNKREFQLKWEVHRAKQVTLDGEETGLQGDTVVQPPEPRQYILMASNRNGSVSKTVQVDPLPPPKARTSENIKITLSASQLQVQAGIMPAILTAQIQNQSDIVDKFMVEVEGLDDSWYSRSASSIALMPNNSDQVQINFAPPRKKGVKSGIYPFSVTVHSQSSTQDSASVLGQLEILPAVEVKMKINPFRITSRRKGSFRVNLANTSVSEANISLEATDLDEGCRFRFLQEKVSVGAWNTIEVPMLVRPKRGSVIGEVKRFDISVTGTVEGSNMPQNANCELTHRPLLKDWRPIWRTIRAIIAIAIVVVAVYYVLKMGGGWDILRSDPRGWVKNFVDTIVGWFPQ
ncbi:MAG: hypothetical protein JXA46_13645 [Dehalococcoidales bacterium]|nr:hypothetical protein [Dehalococcoidales bacterium]